MTDKELIERFKKDTELNLPEIITKANVNSYTVSVEGINLGMLRVQAAELNYTPSERFEPSAKIIHDFLENDEFKQKVYAYCRLIQKSKNITTQGNHRVVTMEFDDYHNLLSSPMKDAILESLKENNNCAIFIKVIGNGEDELIRV